MTQKLSVQGRNPIAAGEQNFLLTAVRFDHRDKWGANQWLFICECGNEHVTRADWVRLGRVKSCGCYRDEINGERIAATATTHGHTKNGRITSDYNSWRNMLERCNSPSCPSYKNHGARGIKICERWAHSFENFLADMGPKPTPKHSIGRTDNDGNYEPGNCAWETQSQQMRNRRNTRLVEYQGRSMSLAEACELAGQSRTRVNARLRMGWNIERALAHGDGRSDEV